VGQFGWRRGDKLASIVSMSVAVAMLPLGVVAVVASLRPGGQKPPVDGSLVDRLDAVSEVLAVAMQIQWETEEQVRRVHDPFRCRSGGSRRRSR
jgi:hypothetical protein